jgi:ABC-2 type transport system ATP-binding protein
MNEPMIRTTGLTKDYGKFRALDSLDIEIRRGEIYGFLGPNGAGKTTTFRIIAGLMRPTNGEAFIDGHSILREPVQAKSVMGYIPDRPFIYDKLTGSEFLRFVSGLYGMKGSVVEEKIVELLALFELTDWGGELTEAYSHGMKQRLVMCSALIHSPKVIVVDEPMVGLDPKGARLVKRIFRRMAEEGLTIFMSTHTLEVAESMCDRIGIINEGKVIASGTMEDMRKLSKGAGDHLESIFLKLTGGEEVENMVKALKL